MNYSPASFGAAALMLLLTAGTDARGELIHWSYSWSRSPQKVVSNDSVTTYIELSDESTLVPVVGSSDIVATNLRTYSQADPEHPDHFIARTYTLDLYLLDQASGDSTTLEFTGQFDGTLSAYNSTITNKFTGLTMQQAELGHNLYTVNMTSYTAPGPPEATNRGSIGARAEISVQPIFASLPEPSTFVLAGLGASFLGLARWRRRTRLAPVDVAD